ncbi:MAG: hypothetical protein Q7V20_12650 [Aquabacterium sp.]|uniref:PhaM family polyhydroxyalkanoate granule multifunctional regulatory protein n=1 Tax=Aquabacterium sp. TaxID=1872578 RepID=UPI0027289E6E|nr:PhaM family polyhydroxyalkanoate granule multifunctional regulatory protein [Aquabacterium sp.]MDO9004293.1 hypothetical protein [Aquabacterium sp.]
MPTRPTSPDPSNASGGDAASAFGGLGAGMAFFQDWMKAAGSALPNLQAAQGVGGKSATPWSLPTLDPEELDKRIQDLKTVQFWLEQNSRLIGMTIQGLEVQRMTLTTLRGMNVSMDAVRESLKARTASPAPEAPAAEPEPGPTAPPTTASADDESADQPAVNPLRWWDTLTQQFSNLANQAVQVAQASAQGMEAAASAPSAAPPEPASPPKARKATGTGKVAAKTAARPTRKTSAASVRQRSTDSGSSD